MFRFKETSLRGDENREMYAKDISEAELSGRCSKLHVNGQKGVKDDSGGFWHKGLGR